MPYPRTPILDTFSRADENPLTSTNWATSLNNGCKLVSNQCVQVGPTAFDASTWKTIMGSLDMEVYATLGTVPASDTDVQLIARQANQTDFTGRYMHLNMVNSAGGTTWNLTLYANDGVDRFLATISLGSAFVVGDHVWLKSVNNVHEVYYNGVLMFSVTDTNNYVPAGNYIGLLFGANSAAGFKNFGGGMLPGVNKLLFIAAV